ncbi:MAG: acyl-CoA dehydrogenase family protein [Xanthobacteraceae bacterium]|nr:acyl-CoA dehydrogenase family protein [Xanthobacteraceae bacterium]QYK43787.1 MAG: acyl-CoA dehydrogenase family protein [Xanthobacteraceae bacterium]
MSVTSPFATHEVFNQSPPVGDIDLYSSDGALTGAVAAFGAEKSGTSLREFGTRWGRMEMTELARLANEYTPKLRTHDRQGRRADVVEFHPAYHRFMEESIKAGVHASVWEEDGTLVPGEHVARSTRHYLASEVEQGHLCPITMTHAATGALGAEPKLLREWLPRIRSREYDPRFLPPGEKRGVTFGMGMTEKQGGTDVRQNTTQAISDGDSYRIVGHKWFFSAPMCDAFLVLAQAKGGLTCFLVPRHKPDGTPNALRLMRLKEKLGNRSNASSEVEFESAYALRCGPEGDGVKTIIGMVQLTRLDCVTGSLGIMQGALRYAVHHTRHRTVFQKKLIQQPLMRNVLGDLALEREGALALALRLASAFDKSARDANEAAYARLITPVAKMWVCKATPGFVYEAMECLGGNGYVEEAPLARFYRESPLNAIWEGSGNVMALDLLRGVAREPEAAMRVLAGLAEAAHGLPHAAQAVAAIEEGLRSPDREGLARRTGETLAILAAAAALAQSAPQNIAEAFAERRLGGLAMRSFGNAMPGKSVEHLLERVFSEAA